jgi:hypothetical protein
LQIISKNSAAKGCIRRGAALSCRHIRKQQNSKTMTLKISRLAIWEYYEKAYNESKKWREYYETWSGIAQTAFDHKVRENARHQANGCLHIAKTWEDIAQKHFQTIKSTYSNED